MSLPQTLNDTVFNEAFNIISSNKSKANFLRQSLLQNLSYDNESNSKIIGYLGELEYDLKSLYDILKDLQLSYHEIHNTLIKPNPCLNEAINDERKNNNQGKTYSIVTGKFNNDNKNNFSKINNYYINSPINQEIDKTLQRSTSCKSYLFDKDNNKFDNTKLIRNKYNYLNNIHKQDNNNLSSPKVINPKLNFDYDAYYTDYPLNKPNKTKSKYGSYFDFLNKKINREVKSPLIHPNDNNKENFNNIERIGINSYNNSKNNNIFTFSEQKNRYNDKELNNILQNQLNKDNNIDYLTEYEQNKNKINNSINYGRINKTYEYYRNRNEEEEKKEIEKQKKEIIKNIISEIFQDTNKLNLLKNELGEDIGEKLLSEDIDEKELYKVVEILKKNQEDNNRKKKNIFKKKKFNQPSDKILLREKLNNRRYDYKEYPRGWSSTKDYFINNGSTATKGKKHRKIK